MESGISILYLEQEWKHEFLTYINPYSKNDGTEVQGHWKNPHKIHVLPNGNPSGLELDEQVHKPSHEKVKQPFHGKLYKEPKKLWIKAKDVYNKQTKKFDWIPGKWITEISITHCKDENGNIVPTTSLY
ncbi:hypothetical protein N8654_03235 [Synechococcus sp. AH-601-B19]|nr:hypothetical protein [Synechococcus sp. AH-601-B19]